MNNLERAAEVIDRWTKDGSELNSAVGSPHEIATMLADAGLLMPDLPEPTLPGLWNASGLQTLEVSEVDKDGDVEIEWEEDSDYIYGKQTRSLWLSRDQVLAILAAAKLAEEQA